MSRYRPLSVAAGLAILLVSTACSSSGTQDEPDAKPDATVSTGLLAFDPKNVRIHKGESVTWVGGDNITHLLVEGSYEVGSDGLRTSESDDKAFNLKLSKKGDRVSHTYDRTGTFTYFCTIHHGMNGRVTVS